MKKRDVINISILILITLFIIFYKIIVIPQLLKFESIITTLFLITLTFLTYLLLGYRKTKENLKRKNISNLIIYEIFLYFFIYYGLGFILGFQNNIYSMNINRIITNIINPLLIVISSEVLRNIVIQANKDKKKVIILLTLLLAVLELMETINYFNYKTTVGLFKLLACGLLPLLAKHSMLSYLTYNTGLKNSLIYRLVFSLYIYVVPILPNLGDYLTCLVELIFPFVIFMSTANILTKHEYVEHEIKTKKIGYTDVIITAIFIITVCLVGGVFNHKLVAIASNSMNPYIYRGDLVLIEKTDGTNKYQKDDIISFDYNGKNTVHRIVKIEKIHGEIYYHTKGDNNNTEDDVLVPLNNIHGKVLFKIPYLGYPSILINEFRSGIFGK